MAQKAIQERYPDWISHCYTCGRLNQHGLRIKSYWDEEEAVCHFQPQPYHIAVPGFVNGGILASLIDCHCVATALAQFYGWQEGDLDQNAMPYYVTASLHIDYLRPTPLGPLLEIRARVKESMGRKTVVVATISVGDAVTVRGEVVTVRVLRDWQQ